MDPEKDPVAAAAPVILKYMNKRTDALNNILKYIGGVKGTVSNAQMININANVRLFPLTPLRNSTSMY